PVVARLGKEEEERMASQERILNLLSPQRARRDLLIGEDLAGPKSELDQFPAEVRRQLAIDGLVTDEDLPALGHFSPRFSLVGRRFESDAPEHRRRVPTPLGISRLRVATWSSTTISHSMSSSGRDTITTCKHPTGGRPVKASIPWPGPTPNSFWPS